MLLSFFYGLAALPFFCLYRLSDALFFILYFCIGYRKDIIRTNLRRSFPGHTAKELRTIEKKYYQYVCDLTLETFKTLTISPENMLKRCRMEPEALQLFKQLEQENKSAILVLGHHGNWEWAGNTVGLLCRQKLYVIYHPISNAFYEQLMVRMRTRFGNKLIAMKDTFRAMVKLQDETTMTAFIADQSPSADHAYWLTFLHQDTPVFEGVEKMAKRFAQPVVYVDIFREKRGYYRIAAKMIEENPEKTPYGELTCKHVKYLEESIIRQPETWLWSHRRWKHQRKAVNTIT